MIITYTRGNYISAGYVGLGRANGVITDITEAPNGINCIFYVTTGALHMDELDTIYPSLDTIPYTLDGNFWAADTQVLAAIPNSITKKVKTYTGTATDGELETGEISTGDILRIQKVRPRIQSYSATTTAKVLTRFNENVDTDVQTSDVALSNGEASLRATGRYLRINLKTNTHSGIPNEIEADVAETGKR